MAEQADHSAGWTVLPQGARRFLAKRLQELSGALLFFAAGMFTLALATYNAADPAANNASAAPVANWLALPGAYIADSFLNALGLVAYLPALIIAAWSWRLIGHRGLPWFWFNLAVTPFAIAAVALIAATLDPAASWSLAVGLGGVFGDSLMRLLLDGLGQFQATAAFVPVMLVAAALATGLLLLSLGVTLGEWLIGARALVRASRWSGSAARNGASALLDVARGGLQLRRRGVAEADDDDDGNDEPIVLDRRRGPDGEAELEDEEEDIWVHPQENADQMPPVLLPKKKRVSKSKPVAKKSRRAQAEEQPTLNLGSDGDYQLPPLHMLAMPAEKERRTKINEDALEQNARLLEAVLDDYGVRGKITTVRPGPVVTLYELEPAPGTKTSRVIGLADDIARSMSAISVRVAVVPGRNAIGIELPNPNRETVYLRELLATPGYESPSAALNLALGKDIGGEPVFADLAKMPHLLIAGTTGSGKSVGINTMILSLLYKHSPDDCRLILIDPKMLELSVYDGIPHLLTPVVTDPSKAVMALKWAVREMENRYKAMASLGVRNIANYNQRLSDAKAMGEELTRTVQTGFDMETGEPIMEVQTLDLVDLPYIVVVVDEMADLMMVAGKEIEGAVQRLAQMARAAGIHVVLATQRPSVDVITGTIKANFPTRISFQVTSKIDSRTILGEQGAEQLLGQGDMLYMAGGGRVTRVHGPFVSDEEVEKIVSTLKAQGRPHYLQAVTEEAAEAEDGPGGGGEGGGGRGDALYDQAVEIVARHQKASTSFIQRHLKIGYNRAATLIEMMEEDGVIGAANHVGKREVHAREPDEFE